MSVWYCIPSKRPAEQANEVLKLWRERGYKIALFVDASDYEQQTRETETPADYREMAFAYPGYAKAVNALVRSVIRDNPDCDWIVTGGDDVEPDPNHSAEEIAKQCSGYFFRLQRAETDSVGAQELETFGVMQPTGDRWGADEPWAKQMYPNAPAYIDRVCGSPWLGREFCRRMYGGTGPLFSGYYHMFEDEELQNVAQKLGVLWQRPDLTHHHRHWGRKLGATPQDIPEFLKKVSGPEHWKEAKALFESRKAEGFPGHEPI